MAALVAWVVAAARFRGLWLFVVPAALPMLNFSPWSGWLGFEEFDLLALGTIAGGFMSRHWLAHEGLARPRVPSPDRIDLVPAIALGFVAVSLLAFGRGIADAGGGPFGGFDDYAQASNSVRLVKSLVYAALLWPLLRDELGPFPLVAAKLFASGMQTGLAFVCVVVLWERAAYPGLLDFSSRYRVTALFWEMHVGGGAIDAYLALATPFAVWSLWTAPSRRAWAVAAAVMLLAGYACLTTFSRGLYGGVVLPLLMLGMIWWSKRRAASSASAAAVASLPVLGAFALAAILPVAAFALLGLTGAGFILAAAAALFVMSLRLRALIWRRSATLALALALATEAVAVIGGGSFMRARLEASQNDLGARLEHWQRGLELMSGADDWLFGIGLGRLPARYSRSVAGGEFSGRIELVPIDHARVGVRVSGPPTLPELGGLYTLTQRIAVRAGGAYRLRLKARAKTLVVVAVDVCEQHLLYGRRCQGKFIRIRASGGDWQEIATPLDGPALSPGPWYAPRLGALSLGVLDPGAAVEIAEMRLAAPDGAELLVNGSFVAGLAHWWPVASYHFTPWHIDNLALELLVERGAVGLALFAALVVIAFRRLLALPGSPVQIAPFLAAALLGALIVGSVSSILDVPRIAFLLFLLLLASLNLPRVCASGTESET